MHNYIIENDGYENFKGLIQIILYLLVVDAIFSVARPLFHFWGLSYGPVSWVSSL